MSTVRIFAISLLLLVCGPVLRQAYAEAAGTIEERLAMMTGIFTNVDQIKHQHLTWNRAFNDRVINSFQPVDIPALNEYFPLLFTEYLNGDVIREGIILTLFITDTDALGMYLYNFTDSWKQRGNNAAIAELTMDDLETKPLCQGMVTAEDAESSPYDEDTFILGTSCYIDEFGNSATYYMFYTSTSMIVKVYGHSPERYSTNHPYEFEKILDFPIPVSWYARISEA